jgi:predicted PolB exonuclease-like 3'-5' exonuclease
VIVSFDIETIPNADVLPILPEPEVKLGNLKDPAKIADKKAEARAEQVAEMALDPLTGRVASYALAGHMADGQYAEAFDCLAAKTDDEERRIIGDILTVIAGAECRLVTWNGIGFDLPFVYKRAVVLGVCVAQYGAPALTTWTKKYATDRHYDLMQIWGGWSSGKFTKLDYVASLMLGERKVACDVTKIAEMLDTVEGRDALRGYNLQDARLTWRLFNRMEGSLFV